jgi:ribosome-binding protein aMBF1 (putative translation factor)
MGKGNMKTQKDQNLATWGKKFSKEQKKAAKTSNNYYEVVKEFKKTRQSLGLTQQEVAERSGMDRTIITKIESGARNTTINSLIMLAEAMDKKLKIDFV